MSPTQTTTQLLTTRGNEALISPAKRRLHRKVHNFASEKRVVPPSPKDDSILHSRPRHEVPEPPKKKLQTSPPASLTLKKILSLKRVRNFKIGPQCGSSPVKCVEQYLARKDGSDNFYVIKILTLRDEGEKSTMDDIQGKNLLHTEHSLLDLIKDEKGVIHQHGLFRETVEETFVTPDGKEVKKDVRRICLVLDCYIPHDFSPKYRHMTNMQQYVIKEKKLPESEALRIFYNVVQIVERLHKLNVVHRDLKLGNIILNKDTREVFLSNFCLGKHLTSENVRLTDQRGSPAYISPDVISGKPYLGKPSDMWALGIVLYTMLYGQFPFYDQSPNELFRKIKLGEFQIPPNSDVNVSEKTISLIKSLLNLNPATRATASQAVEAVKAIIDEERQLMSDSDEQVVPDFPVGAERPKPQNVVERYASVADDALVDLASVLLAKSTCSLESSLDTEDKEFSSRKGKNTSSSQSITLPIGKGSIRIDELHALHILYMAHKLKEAASLGKLAVPLAHEDLFSTIPSNALTKSAKTNHDSARVPSTRSKYDADVMTPSVFVDQLESKLALLADQKTEKALGTSPIINNNYIFRNEQLPLI